ncbi:hypothetical protein [Latilactobacillus curvatus]
MNDCKYCTFDIYNNYSHAHEGVCLPDSDFWMAESENGDIVELVSPSGSPVVIKYCPMCGRKLGD